MTNLTSSTTKSSLTTYVSKSFNTFTPKGNKIKISVVRRIVNVGSNPFISKYEYFIDTPSESLKAWDKESFLYYVNYVDEYYTN
tara:strand:- start:489 stop:740 length:252 start_codon:yes stop_codon:yes gene_type:complete